MLGNRLVVIGALFGDEGKAKIVDWLSDKYDYVVRYQGGDNAGHSVVVGENKVVFRAVPSGILRTQCVIANGVVVNPENLLVEIDSLKDRVDVFNRLRISKNAHVVFDWNISLDNLIEKLRGNAVGTTGRGIGPTYALKALRLGARVSDLLDKEKLKEIIRSSILFCNPLFEKYNFPIFDLEKSLDKYCDIGKSLSPFLTDTTTLLNDLVDQDKKVLFEGGQGLLLDLDFGTYPFVTSSNIVGGLVSGTGLSCDKFTDVLGVVKAYTTRVGNGEFVTEIEEEEIASRIREIGHEFGSVTGRSRRIGWLDLVAVKYGVRFSGINSIALTLVDVLSGFEEVKVCVGYKDKDSDSIITTWGFCSKLEPVYKVFKGWEDNFENIRCIDDFSIELREFIRFIEEYLKVPVKIVSYGKRRDQVVMI